MTHPTDDEIIKRCKAAGIRWLPPAPDAGEGDFPGAFDLVTMVEMRALLLAEQARPTQVMQEARETLLIAAANFGGVAPSARDRCIRAANALHEVYTAQPLKAEQAKDAAEDAELLDWIFRQGDEFSYYVIQDAPGDGEYVVHGMGCSGQGKTPRAAIRAAIIADLCGDVEPVAWMGVSGVGERIVSKTQMYPFMTTPLYPAHTVAALAARVAELEKDAGRYRWLRDGELTAEYPYPVMRMGGSRVDDRTIWAEELDAAIDAAALAAKGQAS